MLILYLYHGSSCIYCLYLHIDIYAAWHIAPRVPSSNISSMSLSVNNSNSNWVFFKHACHANPGADKKWAGSSSYISMHLSLKFQIHPQVMLYQIEHISHGILLSFLF